METQDKCSVLATKAVETQDKCSVSPRRDVLPALIHRRVFRCHEAEAAAAAQHHPDLVALPPIAIADGCQSAADSLFLP